MADYYINKTAAQIDALLTKIDGVEANAEVNQNAVSNIKINSYNIEAGGKTSTVELIAGDNIAIVPNALAGTITISFSGTSAVQADWSQQDSEAYDYIKNKPTIPAAQVNADWNAVSGVSQILNKPTIPAAQVSSDWNASSGVAQILNKPTLGTAAAANTTTSITSGGTGLPTSGAVYGVTGNKNSLTTTVKTDLVSAINEINGTIGDINTVLESVL